MREYQYWKRVRVIPDEPEDICGIGVVHEYTTVRSKSSK